MGYYIQAVSPLGKAKYLVEHEGAELVLSPESFNFDGSHALICVVENGLFDAAGIAYNARERDAFNAPSDKRAKTWLKLPKLRVIELCPQVSEELT